MIIAVIHNAEAVGWICFGFGVIVTLAGAILGIIVSLKHTGAEAMITQAKAKIDETKTLADVAATPGLESTTAASSATEASVSAEAAKSALEQVQGIVASLPVDLRFAGLLVLIGAVLISVATIQFGGVSLF